MVYLLPLFTTVPTLFRFHIQYILRYELIDRDRYIALATESQRDRKERAW
jgi:hypothetical protein